MCRFLGFFTRIAAAFSGQPERLIPFYSEIKLLESSKKQKISQLNAKSKHLKEENLNKQIVYLNEQIFNNEKKLNDCVTKLESCKNSISKLNIEIKSKGCQITQMKNTLLKSKENVHELHELSEIFELKQNKIRFCPKVKKVLSSKNWFFIILNFFCPALSITFFLLNQK